MTHEEAARASAASASAARTSRPRRRSCLMISEPSSPRATAPSSSSSQVVASAPRSHRGVRVAKTASGVRSRTRGVGPVMIARMRSPREADLRRLFDRSPVGMYRSTAQGRFVYVNPALVRMLGYDHAEQLLALDLPKDLYVDPSERAPLVERYLGQGVVDGVEVRWRTRQGAVRVIRIYGYAVRDEVGDGFEATVVDVTAERRLEQRLVDAQRAEGLGVLAGCVAHD